MEKYQELFTEWLKNLDYSFNTIIMKLDTESLILLNTAFKEGYEKGIKEKQTYNYQEWNQK